MQESTCDVLVIGAGPAGYPAAIRAAQLGMKTVVVDAMRNPDTGAEGAWGGVCANAGCIPSKAMIAASTAAEEFMHGAPAFGISVDPGAVHLDFARMQAHRAQCVKGSNTGLAHLFAKYKVRAVAGTAAFEERRKDFWCLSVQGSGGEEKILARHVIIACGTRARELEGAGFDEKDIVSHIGALQFPEPPKSLGIIGAGVIGLELGSLWHRLGSAVTLIDVAPEILASADSAVRRTVRLALDKDGLIFEMSTRVQSVEKTPEGVRVRTSSSAGGQKEFVFDKLLVAAGRVSLAQGIAPEKVGLKLTERGYIAVDDCGRTNLENVWAAGDVTGGIQLAHAAREQGLNVIASIAAGRPAAYHSPVPSVVYVEPEAAWVGESEDRARARGEAVRTGLCPFAANGRARAQDAAQGFVKVVVQESTDRILGVHIVGCGAADLAAEAACAIAFGATAEDLGLVMHPHPSFSEALMQAALASRRQATDI